MKPEKKSWTRALFAYAGGEKKKLVLSVVLSVLSVTLGLAPFYCMYGLLCQFAAGTATSAPVCQASARKNPIARSRAGKEKPGIQRISGFGNDVRIDQRLLNCGARRAALRPYFLRSFILGSRVSRPAAFRGAR